jgi:hypothetical protein
MSGDVHNKIRLNWILSCKNPCGVLSSLPGR